MTLFYCLRPGVEGSPRAAAFGSGSIGANGRRGGFVTWMCLSVEAPSIACWASSRPPARPLPTAFGKHLAQPSSFLMARGVSVSVSQLHRGRPCSGGCGLRRVTCGGPGAGGGEPERGGPGAGFARVCEHGTGRILRSLAPSPGLDPPAPLPKPKFLRLKLGQGECGRRRWWRCVAPR